jgi:hypothetical protein
MDQEGRLPSAADVKEAILRFQYAEKLKSGLIIGMRLLNHVVTLKGDELSGGKKALVWYLEGLSGELQIAGNVLGTDEWNSLERKLNELMGRIELLQFAEALSAFSEAISLATTSCQSSMNFLMEKHLI